MSPKPHTSGDPSFHDTGPPVPSRKSKGSKKSQKQIPLSARVAQAKEALERDVAWITECQNLVRTCLLAVSGGASSSSPDSGYQQQKTTESLSTQDSLPRCEKAICLGLGSPASSPIARVQLAFFLGLCDMLQIEHVQAVVYDPVFTAEDLALCAHYGFRHLPTPTASDHVAGTEGTGTVTLFFMPHCDLQLYETVLRENWSRDRLTRSLFVCNRLGDYMDNNPRRKLESESPSVLRIVPFLAAHPLPACTEWPTAFNNTAVQYLASKPPDDLFPRS